MTTGFLYRFNDPKVIWVSCLSAERCLLRQDVLCKDLIPLGGGAAWDATANSTGAFEQQNGVIAVCCLTHLPRDHEHACVLFMTL